MAEEEKRAPAAASDDGMANVPLRRRRYALRDRPWAVIGVVALGGAIGAVVRFGIGVAWPTGVESFPLTTFTINIAGCALIGVLMVLSVEVWPAHRLVRLFAGTGLLGGFTTFSAYSVEIERLVAVGSARTALLYLVATPVAAVAAVWLTAVLTRGVLRRIVAR